jgi:hypothetical protein
MPSEIDHGMFVLSVDLWNHEQTRQENVVKNSQSSPSISSTALAAYTDVAQAGTAYTNNANAMTPGLNPYDGLPYQVNDEEPQRMPVSSSHPSGMFTRNLIGSLAASAFRLTGPDDKVGIWFVLQDLSVRTEGNFRYGLSEYNYPKSLTVLQPPLLVCERRRYRRPQPPVP